MRSRSCRGATVAHLSNGVLFSNTLARVAFVATPFSARNHDCDANVCRYIGCQQLTLQNGRVTEVE